MNAPRYDSTIRFGPPLTPIVKRLMIVTVVVFLTVSVVVEELFSRQAAGWIYGQFGLSPRELLSSLKFWQPLTYVFLHQDVGHVFWNMITLWMFGADLEQHWGGRRVLLIYLMSGVGGAMAMIAAQGNLTIGASGAVMGLVAAYGVLFAERPLSLLFPPVTLKAKWLSLAWVAIDFIYFLKGPGSGIAYFAHFGGALSGFLMAHGLRRTKGLSLLDRWKRMRARRHLRLIEKRDREFDERGPTLH